MKVSFQDGCKKIVDKLTALNYPPEEPQGPVEINTQIQNIYNDRYAKGYADGIKQSASNAHIVYTYHTHVSGCYSYERCTGYIYNIDMQPNGAAKCFCTKGHVYTKSENKMGRCDQFENICICGKNESTIEKAVITF